MSSAANSGISRVGQQGQQAVDQWKNYVPKNTGASMVNQGMGALTSWGLANPGNETIGPLVFKELFQPCHILLTLMSHMLVWL